MKKKSLISFWRLVLLAGIIFLAQRCSCQQQLHSCSLFTFTINNTGHILQVNEGNSCILKDHEIWNSIIFDKITIRATVEIRVKTKLHLKYKQLVFGPNGNLTISQSQQSPLIILEQIDHSLCELNLLPLGYLNIRAASYIIYPLQHTSEKGDSYFSHYLSRGLSPNQNITFINPHYLMKEETLTIERVEEDGKIYLNQPLENNYEIYSSQIYFGESFFYSSSRNSSGVIFINSCINAKVEELIGVHFINMRGLRFDEGKIADCLFEELEDISHLTNVEYEGLSQKRKYLYFHSKVTYSIFVSLTKYSINFYGKANGSSSLFHDVKKSEIVFFSNNHHQNLQIIGCQIVLEVLEDVVLESLYVSTSSIKFSSERLGDVTFGPYALLSGQSNISFVRPVTSLTFDRVSFIDVSFDLSSTIIEESLSIYRSHVYQHQDSEYFFNLPLRESSSKPLKINLTTLFILGKSKNLFVAKPKSPKPKYLLEIPTVSYIFDLQKVIFNESSLPKSSEGRKNNSDQNVEEIFKMDNKVITQPYIGSQSKGIMIKAEEYNLLSSSKQPISDINDDRYFLTPSYSELKISTAFFFLEPRSFYFQSVKFDGSSTFVVDQNRILQILPEKIYNLGFQNELDLKELNVGRMDLMIRVVKSEDAPLSNFKVVFYLPNQALQEVKVFKYPDNVNLVSPSTVSEKIYKPGDEIPDDSIGFIQNSKQNSFEVVWTNKEEIFATFKIELEMCDRGLYLVNSGCVEKCSKVSQSFLCADSCSDGYYLNPNNQSQICSACPIGCLRCEAAGSCEQCKEGYFLHGTKCITQCEYGYFFDENECKKCNTKCAHCITSADTCLQYNKRVCISGSVSHEADCVDCHPSCSTCLGRSGFECTSCQNGYEMKHGVCRLIITKY